MGEARPLLLGVILASSIWSVVFGWSNAQHMRAYNDLTTRWQSLLNHRHP